MTTTTDPADLAAAARTVRDADRLTRDGWPLGDDTTREVVVAATTLLDVVDALAYEVECHRDAARRAHDRLVSEAAVMTWATDGRLDTAVRHAVEYIRLLRFERDDARASLAAVLTECDRLDDPTVRRAVTLTDVQQRIRRAAIPGMGRQSGPGAPSAGGVGPEGVGDAQRPGEGRGA